MQVSFLTSPVLFLVFIFWSFLGSAGLADLRCNQEVGLDLDQVKTSMYQALNQVDQEIQSLEIPIEEIVPISKLGANGASGVVFLVRWREKLYALKLFFFVDETLPAVFDVGYKRNTGSAIIIQKYLGLIGIAPKVIGVSHGDGVNRWVHSHPQIIAAGVRSTQFVLLMELTSPQNFKNFFNGIEKIRVTPKEIKSLYQQAEDINEILQFLEINPQDLDVVITEDRKLMLIDISYYTASRTSSEIVWQLRQMIHTMTVVQDSL